MQRTSAAQQAARRKQPAVSASLVRDYQAIREQSLRLIEPLEPEDCVVQTMADVSPTRWHLGHTTWFFETFVLRQQIKAYRSVHAQYNYLFNSYYNAVGAQFPRPARGTQSRPTVQQVLDYRAEVDERMQPVLEQAAADESGELARIIRTGLSHEQQHQELMLTDIKHVFASNPLRPIYRSREWIMGTNSPKLRWASYAEGLRWIGHDGSDFAYDNEGPRHRAFLEGYELANRLVTNAEYLEFIEDGGYERPELWLDEGWLLVREHGWGAPLYWERVDGQWWHFTLAGRRELVAGEPVCHVSFYEADAFARWAGSRLATEAEWEHAASDVPVAGNFVETGALHPLSLMSSPDDVVPKQMFGDVWEWTASPYVSYPGYKPPEGALGEYNAKFMSSQMVLRGGSCGSAQAHLRRTYRNFFPPASRWQFTGIRLAR
jgi:ergothioneine biosynthesis protein EgtB